MVCDNSSKRPLGLKERCEILGISLARADFLISCAHDDTGRGESGMDRGQTIPYDPGVQIKEAFRLGISLTDTSVMMGMTKQQVEAYGLPFRSRSAFPPPPGQSKTYNLFPPDPKNDHEQTD